jgi:streptogramin lyase
LTRFRRPFVLALALGLPGDTRAQSPLSSSAVLAQLPDGPAKRQFIIDCTNCHQMSAAYAYPNGKARSRDEWDAIIARMAGFAGYRTGFPIMSAAVESDSLAAYLARHLAAAPAAEAPLAAGTQVVASPRVREFLFPEARDLPHDVAVDSTGRVLVTGMFSDAIYALDTASGAFRAFGIPVQRANPRAIEVAANGDWWVVLGGPNRLARYTPSTDQWKSWDVRMYAHSSALGADGKVWFNGHFTRAPEQIGYVEPRTDSVHFITLPPHPTRATEGHGPIPYELRIAPSGTVWMSELQGHRMVAYDPRTGRARTWELPTSISAPRRFDIDRTGALWIPAYAAGTLVRFDPEADRMEEIPLPRRDAVPYVVRVTRADVWVGTNASDEIYRYNAVERRWTVYPLPGRGAVIRHMVVDPRNGDLWLAYGASPGIPARIARLTP